MTSLLSSRIPSQYIGFHNLLRNFEFLLNTREPAWPFYSVKQVDDNNTNIYMSLAGFSKDEISVSINDIDNVLTVKAAKVKKLDGVPSWNNLAERNVTKSFTLSPDISGEPKVTFKDGLLTIHLTKVPKVQAEDRLLLIE